MKHDYFLIPVELCQYVVTNSLTNPFKLYLLLKMECDGTISLNKQRKQEIALKLDCHERTVRNNLDKLKKLNWIGGNNDKTYKRLEKHCQANEISRKYLRYVFQG